MEDEITNYWKAELADKLNLQMAERAWKNEDAVKRMWHFLEASYEAQMDTEVKRILSKSIVGILNRIYLRDDGWLSHPPTENAIKNNVIQITKKRRRKVKHG